MTRRVNGLFWDRAWSLIEGCTPCSPGCRGCWAAVQAHIRSHQRNEKILDTYGGLTNPGGKYGPFFNGTVRFREDLLGLPLRTKKPTVWAVWTDLFHPKVPDEFRDRAYAVMTLCPQHTFLVLTKRAAGMAEYCRELLVEKKRRICSSGSYALGLGVTGGIAASKVIERGVILNVYHGVTAENQQAADERISHLLRVPGKRFVNCEPFLGPVDIDAAMRLSGSVCGWCGGYLEDGHDCYDPGFGIHAVLAGGESGPNARPCHPDWARSLRDQCAEVGIPFFWKQWGEFITKRQISPWIPPSANKACFFDGHPASMVVWRVGKKRAGRLLDGRTHDYLPW